MAWLILFIAGLFECGWAIGLKYTEGFTKFWPATWVAVAMLISVWLLAIAVRSLPIGSAYAIWTGIGAVATVIFGIILFNEPATLPRLACVFLIISGIVGLKLVTP